jgi:hypothetical protein
MKKMVQMQAEEAPSAAALEESKAEDTDMQEASEAAHQEVSAKQTVHSHHHSFSTAHFFYNDAPQQPC